MQELNQATKKNALMGELVTRGTNLAAWARANGYKPITVQAVVRKYWGHPNPPIQGILTHEILTKLKAEIEATPKKASNGD